MKVKLIAHTPEPDKIVAYAARLCYSPVGIEEIKENMTDEAVEKLLNLLMNSNHESPVEHVNFTFAVEGVSRTLTHQLVRHRIASYSQQSQRYVRLDQFEYIIPPSIEADDLARKIFLKHVDDTQNSYNCLVEILLSKQYKKRLFELTQDELSDKKILSKIYSDCEKKAIEDARYVFPNACESKIVFTMNARTLYNFFKHRCCNRAQWEIRGLADRMLEEVKEVAPVIFKRAGALCVFGKCPEGSMTCGTIKKVVFNPEERG